MTVAAEPCDSWPADDDIPPSLVASRQATRARLDAAVGRELATRLLCALSGPHGVLAGLRWRREPPTF